MIAGVVVFYNPKESEINHILGYIEKIDIFVVIDNSKEPIKNTLDSILSSYQKKVQYRHFPNNIGLCAGFNYGIKTSSENGCDWTLLMDSDSELINDIIEEYKKVNTDKVAVIAPIHIHDRSKDKPYNGVKEIKWAMTSGCLYNNNIFNEIRGFNEDLFVDGLDIDYCYRAREHGYKIMECGNALLQHYPAETHTISILGKKIIKYGKSSPWRYYLQVKSLVWIFLRYRHFSDFIFLIWKWIKMVLFFDYKGEYFINMKKGVVDGLHMYKKYREDLRT
ncbi:MAG: glycosyltransferase [Lachnospiraceae bacterium]|nr:glycosyltransferase [Lachnospiraceae bacterium]